MDLTSLAQTDTAFATLAIAGTGVAMPILIIAGVIALGIVIAVYGHKAAKARRAALLELAARMGLTFDEGPDHGFDDRYRQFSAFRRGDSRRAYNLLHGAVEFPTGPGHLVIGDFRYTTTSGSGKNRRRTTHRFSFLLAHLPHPSTPDTDIRSENMLDKIAGFFSDKDIDFESEEFSRRFHVASADRRFAYDVCHPQMIEFLLETRPMPIDIEHGVLCLTDGVSSWQPDGIEARWAWLHRFLELWPDHVVNDLAARDGVTHGAAR